MDRRLPLAGGIDAGHAVKAELDAVAHHRRPPVRAAGHAGCDAAGIRHPPMRRVSPGPGSPLRCGPVDHGDVERARICNRLGLRPAPQILGQIALVDDLRPVEGPGLDRFHELQAA